MKKIVSLLMVLVLCIACISAPAYAEDLDTPEESADINRNSNVSCYGSGNYNIFSGFSIDIEVEGTASVNNSGYPISFSCSSCSCSASYDNGYGYASVSYSSYSISGHNIYVSVNYTAVYTDINGGYHSDSGSKTVRIYI